MFPLSIELPLGKFFRIALKIKVITIIIDTTKLQVFSENIQTIIDDPYTNEIK
jgi:hypothetical protein